ncbi:hypothetical protein HMSSN139_57880 [Paenibacillus sp. HMSSN-139]|nr:hypothetical protein HMSSN139_57880 [Paenibacillus sp. HMSSN-139]
MGFTRKLAIRNYIVEGLLLLASLLIILPVLIMIFGSFKTSAEVLDFSLKLPKEWMFSNYARVFEEGGMPGRSGTAYGLRAFRRSSTSSLLRPPPLSWRGGRRNSPIRCTCISLWG